MFFQIPLTLIKASLIYFMADGPTAQNPFYSANHHGEQFPPKPLNVALLGAGIFATASHAPVLQKLRANMNCVAVWSRTYENAATLAEKLGATPCTDVSQILNSPNVDAVIMAMPIDVQPQYVLQALNAGKHVLSEQPVAVNMEQARAVIETYEEQFAPRRLVWNVAGKFRYDPAVRTASQALVEIGKPCLVSLKIRAPFLKSTPFSEAMWRNNPSWYGGMLVEAFVHASAMLRGLFGNAVSVSAHTSSRTKHIPSVDTMTAQVTWPDDVQGTMSVTYASTEHHFELEAIGTEGRMVLRRKPDGPGYTLDVKTSNSNYKHDIPFGELETEMMAFLEMVQFNNHENTVCSTTPLEAMADLQLVDACLESGKQNGMPVFLDPKAGTRFSTNKQRPSCSNVATLMELKPDELLV
eukprot:scaffold3296_cov112-Cylindrotheca_fusiformis.AAC.6